MFHGIINAVSSLLSRLLSVLPTSPFTGVVSSLGELQWLGWLNWFFPVSEALALMALWLASIALFYVWSVVARWVKLIGS